jgi:hypothetical protein
VAKLHVIKLKGFEGRLKVLCYGSGWEGNKKYIHNFGWETCHVRLGVKIIGRKIMD